MPHASFEFETTAVDSDQHHEIDILMMSDV